jgi:hypothetical protein
VVFNPALRIAKPLWAIKTEVKPYPRVNSSWKKKIKELNSKLPIKKSFLEKDGKVASIQNSKKK